MKNEKNNLTDISVEEIVDIETVEKCQLSYLDNQDSDGLDDDDHDDDTLIIPIELGADQEMDGGGDIVIEEPQVPNLKQRTTLMTVNSKKSKRTKIHR